MTTSPIHTEPRHPTVLGNVQEILQKAIAESLNVLLVGAHGVGKTHLVCGEASRQKLAFKYYSAATLDPWSDLVGIPIPVEGSGANGNPARHLEFIRPADLDGAEMVFFDELNRSHPKVQNAVLEMIQFKTINGAPLKRLRMVWAAINPPGDVYAVTELDPALLDRFQMYVQVNAAPSAEYYRDDAGIPDPIARALVLWWKRDLGSELQRQISPRRLEYLGKLIALGLPLEMGIPPSVRVPLQNLVGRIQGVGVLPIVITRDTIVRQQEQILAEMNDAQVQMLVADELVEHPDVLPRCVPLYLALSPELQAKLVADCSVRGTLKRLALQAPRNGPRELLTLHDRLRALGVFDGSR